MAPARPVEARPVIQARHLEKTYRDGTRAIKDVTFDVQAGEIFGLLGPNGSGKTTTMRVLGTLHRATGGAARVLGLNPDRDAKKLRRRIGFAMQEVGMDDLATAWEMLIFHAKLYNLPRKVAEQRAVELLQLFELWEHRDRRVTRFSGGMQRRLDLAVSVIHEPEVLFLDEPSTGLDPKSRQDLWRLLRRLRDEKGLTIFMSTHYMEEADALCDRLAITAGGHIVAIDTPSNLKRSVGADRIRVRLGAAPSKKDQQLMAKLFGRDNVLVRDDVAEVKVRDGERALMPCLQHLARLGLTVRSTRVLSPTLDDVYLAYSGERMEDTEATAKALDKKTAAKMEANA